MTAQGKDILAFLDCVFTEQERALTPLVGIGTCPDWGTCQPECTHQFGINDAEAKLRRVAAERKIVDLHRPVTLRGGGGSEYFNTTIVCTSCEPPRQFPETAYPCPTIVALAEGYGWTEGER
ncbi:hypothetical protein ABZ802_31160 [Streptomyces sp. NPDC047737]|uniref:hypothetical protein n=1 Tax=Streptomyces sp. NPDC047737 TaxID=3155740 RepID=UPI0033E12078